VVGSRPAAASAASDVAPPLTWLRPRSRGAASPSRNARGCGGGARRRRRGGGRSGAVGAPLHASARRAPAPGAPASARQAACRVSARAGRRRRAPRRRCSAQESLSESADSARRAPPDARRHAPPAVPARVAARQLRSGTLMARSRRQRRRRQAGVAVCSVAPTHERPTPRGHHAMAFTHGTGGATAARASSSSERVASRGCAARRAANVPMSVVPAI
jgi:hypothetical protein